LAKVDHQGLLGRWDRPKINRIFNVKSKPFPLVITTILVLLITVSVALSRRPHERNTPRSIWFFGPIPFWSEKLPNVREAFQEPLYLHDKIAVRAGTNVCVLKLESVSPSEIEVQVERISGGVGLLRITNENASFYGLHLRWSWRNARSIYIYRDMSWIDSSFPKYSVIYPLDTNEVKRALELSDQLRWMSSPSSE
jgi:hypothetical protein